MKKIYILFLLCGIFSLSNKAFAQRSVYEKGDIIVNAGLSLGVIGYGFGYYGAAGFAVPLTASLDYGIHELISVGPYVGYLRRSYGSIGDQYIFTSFAFGAQGVVHASSFLNENLNTDINEEKVDFYGKLILGFETYNWRYNDGDLTNPYYNSSGRAVFGPVLGVRYMFTPNIGGYAEGGRGAFGWLNLGLSVRL